MVKVGDHLIGGGGLHERTQIRQVRLEDPSSGKRPFRSSLPGSRRPKRLRKITDDPVVGFGLSETADPSAPLRFGRDDKG